MICFISSKAFCQADETFTEERSSDWIKVSFPSTPVVHNAARRKPSRAATASPKKEPVTQPVPPPQPPDAFNKTNNKVKRFQKGNGN